MKRLFIVLAFAFISLGASAQFKVNTPTLSDDPTLSELMDYTQKFEQKKADLQLIYKNKGKVGVKKFLKEESPEIYNNILKSEKNGKVMSIVGGSIFVAGAAGCVTTVLVTDIAKSIPYSLIAGGCGIVAAVGAGIGVAGLITILDADRNGVLLYERAVNDEISKVKSFIPYRASLTFGPTQSGGVGLNLKF